MLKEERQHAIIKEVAVRNRVLLADMAEKLDVSIDTVRRDVKELDATGKLRKVHGGAVSLGFVSNPSISTNIYASAQKKEIAQKALSLIREDSVIFIDGGTTCLELARHIPVDLTITCFTISLPVAMVLNSRPGTRVILIGGEVNPDSQITMGKSTIHELSAVNFDTSFIGTGYVDVEFGLSEMDWDIAQVKKAVVRASKKTILLTISEKLNSTNRFRTCDIRAVNTLITELDRGDKELEPYRELGIELI